MLSYFLEFGERFNYQRYRHYMRIYTMRAIPNLVRRVALEGQAMPALPHGTRSRARESHDDSDN